LVPKLERGGKFLERSLPKVEDLCGSGVQGVSHEKEGEVEKEKEERYSQISWQM